MFRLRRNQVVDLHKQKQLREILTKDTGPFLTSLDVFLTFSLCTYFYL